MNRILMLILFVWASCIASASSASYDLLHKLSAPDGAPFDLFGWSVAHTSDMALVGSAGGDDTGSNSGSAYLFNTTTGNLLHKLKAPDGAADDEFGNSVALTESKVLVGSYSDDDKGSGSGSVYVFDSVTGSLLHKLTAPDGAEGDGFGFSVALAGDMALVGSVGDDDTGSNSGSAYLFNTSTGNFLRKLIAPDGAQSRSFGNSVALTGSTALIGSYLDHDNSKGQIGSAYLFDTTSGDLLHRFTAPDEAKSEFFGTSVALNGDRAIVGSPNFFPAISSPGSAYLFDIVSGSMLQKLTAPDSEATVGFGTSVSLASGTAIVSSYNDDDNGIESGGAYLFDSSTGRLLRKLTAPDGAEGDQFGHSVSLSDSMALVGSPFDEDNGLASGSVYLFRIPEPNTGALCLLGMLALMGRRRSV